jgi:hypothetical protein
LLARRARWHAEIQVEIVLLVQAGRTLNAIAQLYAQCETGNDHYHTLVDGLAGGVSSTILLTRVHRIGVTDQGHLH